MRNYVFIFCFLLFAASASAQQDKDAPPIPKPESYSGANANKDFVRVRAVKRKKPLIRIKAEKSVYIQALDKNKKILETVVRTSFSYEGTHTLAWNRNKTVRYLRVSSGGSWKAEIADIRLISHPKTPGTTIKVPGTITGKNHMVFQAKAKVIPNSMFIKGNKSKERFRVRIYGKQERKLIEEYDELSKEVTIPDFWKKPKKKTKDDKEKESKFKGAMIFVVEGKGKWGIKFQDPED